MTDAVEKFSIDQDNHLKNLSGKGMLDFNLSIEGGTKNTDPIDVACDFSVNNGEIIEPVENIKLKNIQINGHYNKRDSTLEELLLSQVSFDSETGPFSGNLSIINFENPTLRKGSLREPLILILHTDLFIFPNSMKSMESSACIVILKPISKRIMKLSLESVVEMSQF